MTLVGVLPVVRGSRVYRVEGEVRRAGVDSENLTQSRARNARVFCQTQTRRMADDFKTNEH
jgi:hypothetical protein